MRHNPIAIASLLVLAAALPANAAKQPRVEGERLEFRIPDLDGNPVSLSDERFAGKVVLVDLWGTWCPPCVSEIPTLVDLQERYREQGLVIVAIAFEADADPESRRAYLREYVAEQGVHYLVLDGGPPEAFETALPAVKNVRGFPIEIFIGRDGKVVEARNSFGFKASWAKKLTRELETLLHDPSIP
jgi:thiol-disulfide isomerase/thioredoxin